MTTRTVITFSATAACERCEWRAQMSGDDELEVITFLRARLIEHATRECPKRPEPVAVGPS